MVLHEIRTSPSFHGGHGAAVSCGCGWTAEVDSYGAAEKMIEQHRLDVRRQNAEARLRDTVTDPAKRVEL